MRVLIAGAGPTGLTLAIELARREVDVRVVDKAAEFFAGSRGDGLQPRTLEVFDDLGVVEAVLEAGITPPPMRAYVAGEFVGEHIMFELSEPTPDVPYPNGCMLGQSRTEQILRERLAGFGVRVELGTELTGFTQDDTGVDVVLNGTERTRVDYLVGADGGKSFVRKSLGIPFEGTTDESIRLLVGDVAADGLDHDRGHWFGLGPDPREGIVLMPLSGGAQFQFAAPLEGEPTLAGLQALLDRYSGGMGIRLHELTWSTVWRPNTRLAARYREGRVFLAGDAAHTHPPTGGQGLNTGVQDAANLGWKLAAEEHLDTYEAERLPVAASVLGLSTESLRKYLDGDADAHRRGAEYHQLGISYAGGPLARDERAVPGRVVAGDRAPDAPVDEKTRLFDLFRGPHWTTLAFGCPAPAEEHAHSVDGIALEIYDVKPGTIVRVRPDGYIGSITA
ncbi:FAD-dependent monooxygenase [Amycolatopsis albispora]|uniref:3-(3-hydroxyphenyl)propionate hydroxylase n=1 Tax=Amycolatopsis albispora TaxID=1804986 RepID=A0A344LGD0_9PSEU|nr:FAD-dependent monooxygenase [Amycolatopsis albispora]AXB47104.1 3-(3-hydroxyphenyl)propionate hydroxylase [Amycolatopsis albispora]